MQHLQKALDEHLRSCYTSIGPGAALLVSVAGETLYASGIGIADLTSGEKITPVTTFRLASVSKQFTAMCIQLLEHEGRLSYDDTLRQFFPEFPASIRAKVTLQHLLSHTSGLLDYEEFVEERPGWQIGDEEVLAIAASQNGTYFTPGTQYRYSNTGYVLLALVVERVSGIAYADFLQQRVFEPLDMNHTMLYEKGKPIPERAMGYARNGAGEIVLADQGTCTATKGDGCIYTSVREYHRWHQALSQQAGMAPALEQVYAPIPGYTNGFYGMGWFFSRRKSGGLEMYHTGNTSGFSNLVIRIPENDMLIACFSNIADNTHLLTSLLDVLGQFPVLRTESGLIRNLLQLTR
ncbi:serine hydrolase domain-containing protein [Pontibacter virosus]|uniref:CubicO group peptidase (Beta-lactamase class C family) n=1 Tax=Pontibacter virosus TaxID=1765052 RepID=A0A2U1AM13_9BACT|nr:serine hydrolase domain-containing protein [Pontibacter virosus]PVY37377.1 CubicO group peptidase (beta-lactamase class C family) [Pontibacter virosus]